MNFPPPTGKQARLIWFTVSAGAVATLIALLVAIVWGLGMVLHVMGPVLWPIAMAGVIAYLLDPLVDLMERRGTPRLRAILCVFALALGLLVALFGSVVPQAVDQARQLVSRIPSYANSLQVRVEHWITAPPTRLRAMLDALPFLPHSTNASEPTNHLEVSLTNRAAAVPPPPAATTGGVTNVVVPAEAGLTQAWQQWLGSDALQSASGWLATVLPRLGSWVFGQVTKVASWIGVLAGLALVPVYLFYFLLEKRGIQAQWTDYLPVADSRFKEELVFVLTSINDYLIAFFRGQVLVAVCDGILYGIGFALVGLPYALLIGLAAMGLTMIPFLGAFVVCGSALIIAIVQFGDWLHPLLVLAVFAVVQTLEGFVIQPKIMGDRVGLHPVAIIMALMVGTTLLGGILGGILAIPLAAALRVIMFRYIWKQPAQT